MTSVFLLLRVFIVPSSTKKTVASLSHSGFKVRRTLKGHLSKVYAIHWAANQPHIVSASQDGKLIVWNAETTNKLAAVPLRSTWVMTCAFSPNAQLVASGGLDNICTVYGLRYKESLPTKIQTELVGHTGYLSCCRFLDDDKILSSSGDTSCILWDIERSKQLLRFQDHDSDVMR